LFLIDSNGFAKSQNQYIELGWRVTIFLNW
jgi:hypothetical protein